MADTRNNEHETCVNNASRGAKLAEPGKLYYKACRENANMTQEQATEMLHIADVSTLSRYENGHIVPDQQLVAKMVMLYRVPNLAVWHVRRTNPALAEYLPEITELRTDGDTYMALDLSADALSGFKEDMKRAFSEARAPGTAASLKPIGAGLKKVADDVLSIAAYINGKL